MNLDKYYEKRECVVCSRKYYVHFKKGRVRLPKGVRARNTKTCSKPCSRKYAELKRGKII